MSEETEEKKAPEKRGRPVLLAAGGTGGHLFPAEALAGVLEMLGVPTALMTDERVENLPTRFPADEVYTVPAATPSGGNIADKIGAVLTLGRGVLSARSIIAKIRPRAIVGFGGYPTVPPLLAASWLKVPIVIHEQNAVLGRANRFLAGRAKRIATGFHDVIGVSDADRKKLLFVGNPVRLAVLAAARKPIPPVLKGGRLRLLVFGGSQGARVMSDILPSAIERLPGESIKRITIVQQAREEDLLRVRAFYAKMNIEADVQPFFPDLPTRMAEAHLVIARSGASTVAELAAIGRPSILVPLPGSLDQDQAMNAKMLGDIGAASVIPQQDFTPERLATELLARLADPEVLTRAAEAAKSAGKVDSAQRLAALVVQVAKLPIKVPQPAANAE